MSHQSRHQIDVVDQQIRGNARSDSFGVWRVTNRRDMQRLARNVGRRANHRVETLEQPAHQHRAAPTRGLDDTVDIRDDVGDRLFDQQRQTGVDDSQSLRVVELRGSCDHHRVGLGELGLGDPPAVEPFGMSTESTALQGKTFLAKAAAPHPT